jgi:hypothetical protein
VLLKWKNKEYALVRPGYVDPETGLKVFPGILRPAGVKDFMKLSIGG